MRLIPLSEFQELVGISTNTLGILLKTSALPCRADDAGAVSVDIEALSVRKMVKSIEAYRREQVASKSSVIDAEVETLLSEQFESILKEALTRFLTLVRR